MINIKCNQIASAACAFFVLGVQLTHSTVAGAPKVTRIDRVLIGDVIEPSSFGRSDIFYIGDSESLGYFGERLYESLSQPTMPTTKNRLRVASLWVCGSDAESWVKGDIGQCGIRICYFPGKCVRDNKPTEEPRPVRYRSLMDYLAATQPRMTVVALGTNMLTLPQTQFHAEYSVYFDRVLTIVREILARGSRCVWIGPPQISFATKSRSVYDQFVFDLRHTTTSGGCAFLDSSGLSDRRFLRPTDPEGVHYLPSGEIYWEKRTWESIKSINVRMKKS